MYTYIIYCGQSINSGILGTQCQNLVFTTAKTMYENVFTGRTVHNMAIFQRSK